MVSVFVGSQAVLGSGIMADRLAGGDVAVALLGNRIATVHGHVRRDPPRRRRRLCGGPRGWQAGRRGRLSVARPARRARLAGVWAMCHKGLCEIAQAHVFPAGRRAQ